ncbi:hypothetical protein CPB84DRAFT_1763539 [Gymnopilus junonius]|uniref:Histone H1 n=1 Tax=Gymnopilus junonius TaxID=109634 RepID=A0A9P5NZ98_GYMJU|nr:hypothetical protein CPB84DRAFT_1763539 [Gymnopilus junonius]
MDSLKSPTATESTPAAQEAASNEEPRPPDKEGSPAAPETATELSAPAGNASATTTTQSAEQSTENTSSTTAAPEPSQPAVTSQTSPTTHPIPTTQPVPTPYGYAQAAYPISPYYAQAAGAYSYPYSAYASAYHAQATATYPTQPAPVYPMSVARPPAQAQQEVGTPNDDLPSYEEMIVEALTGCSDPEGLAPKDLFTLMSQRYPLQSNFRPSASQALQKAYKRGRFEKSASGKYRLNPSWEGGNTTRRTTRRPQTHNTQSTPSNSTPAPPFTHAPLVHNSSTSTQSAAQPTYATQPYGYPYYPGYPTQPQASTSATPATTITAAAAHLTADKTTPATANADADSDAYEAAQNILNAINFGSMYSLSPEERQGEQGDKTTEEQQAEVTNGVEAIATNAGSAMAPPTQIASDGSVEDPRAELQAQLALLAAQLAELAQAEDSAPLQQVAPVPAKPLPNPVIPQVPQQHVLPVSVPDVPILAPTPVIVAGDKMPDRLPEDDSDDDDMEEVI